MTNKHTPGPWKIDDRTNIGAGFSIISTTAHYSCCGVAHYVGEADAILIAAAPETSAERDQLKEINAELLAALVAMKELVVGSGLNGSSQQVAKARAAIAKATGEHNEF